MDKLLLFLFSILILGTIGFMCLLLCFLSYLKENFIGDEENEKR